MARQVIDLTTPQPGGRQGEPTASAWTKVNDMTLELYAGTAEVDGDQLIFDSGVAEGTSLSINNVNGGGPVVHYQIKYPGQNYSPSGALIGAAGARPWLGSGWSGHSLAGYHIYTAEAHTATANGTNIRMFATPIGGTWEQRVAVADFNGDGDLIMSKDLTRRKIAPTERGRGLEIVRQNSGAEAVLVTNAPGISANFRGYLLGASVTAPVATQQDQAVCISLTGHDSVNLTNAKALISLAALATWSPTNTPTKISFQVTGNGTSRAEALVLDGGTAALRPGFDGSQPLGTASMRWGQIWSASSTISTSDANLKQDMRELTNEEVACGMALAKSIGFFRWRDSVAKKGAAARWHCGVYAQRVVEICESYGLDAFTYGFVCYDEWEATPEIYDDSDGVRVTVAAAREAGNLHSVRYDQLAMFMGAAFAAKIESL